MKRTLSTAIALIASTLTASAFALSPLPSAVAPASAAAPAKAADAAKPAKPAKHVVKAAKPASAAATVTPTK